MGRIYRSAKKLARRSGMDEDELQDLVEQGVLEGSGKGGAVTKEDLQEYLEGSQDHGPSKEDLIRRGLAEGRTNEEIGELVHEVLGDDVPWQNGFVSWTIGNERRNETDWWMDYGPRVVVERGVKAGPLDDEALKEAREKYGEDESDEEAA